MKGLWRAWGKTGDAAPKKVRVAEGADRFEMHERFLMLLWVPLQDVEKLDKRVINSALGKLECDGLVGHFHTQHDQIDVHLIYELRLHEEAPFGVASVKFMYEAKRSGAALATGTMNLKLTALGQGAKSELPGGE